MTTQISLSRLLLAQTGGSPPPFSDPNGPDKNNRIMNYVRVHDQAIASRFRWDELSPLVTQQLTSLECPLLLKSIEKSKVSSGLALRPHRYCPDVLLRPTDTIFGVAASDARSRLDQVKDFFSSFVPFG